MLPMLPHDKANHVVYGLGAAFLGALLGPLAGLPAPLSAFAACCAVGVAKELYDLSGRGTPDKWDIVATLAGGAPLAIALLVI